MQLFTIDKKTYGVEISFPVVRGLTSDGTHSLDKQITHSLVPLPLSGGWTNRSPPPGRRISPEYHFEPEHL